MADPYFRDALDEGQTPLDPDEARGLKLGWVATRTDLNDAEGENILHGMRWARAQIRRKDVVVNSEAFLRQLHERMFNQVWDWAGPSARPNETSALPPIRLQRNCGSCSTMHTPGRSLEPTPLMSRPCASTTS